jgi:hypothetical protein
MSLIIEEENEAAASSFSFLETANLNLETPYFSCFNGTRKYGIGMASKLFFGNLLPIPIVVPRPQLKTEILKMKSRTTKNKPLSTRVSQHHAQLFIIPHFNLR